MKCPACGHNNLPGADLCERCLESLMQEDVPQAETRVERSIMADPVSILQSPAPETIRLEASLSEAVSHMRRTNIGYVLVLEDEGKMVGILTERDLLCKAAGRITDLASVPVSALMTPNPTALHATEPIKHALFLMAHNGFRHIPLVDGSGRPTGIATVRHLVEYLERLSGGAG